ncbi:MAG: cytochrome c biogenesis protein [Oligoflexia bacterium]|nr:cytochrome c biogenesis protein [Oligoflexia bacterium]
MEKFKETLRKGALAAWVDGLGFAVAFSAVLFALYMVFMVVPNERVMGPVQRIFYFHVGAAVACYCSFGVVLLGGIYYLATRSAIAHLVGRAAGEVGFIFCSITLVSGMIWGHSAWNTWFRWEPRLVTFLLLWVIFLGFNLLNEFGDEERLGVQSAVLGILGAITVPLVVYSIQFLPQSAQLHPQVVGNRGLKDASFEAALAAGTFAMVALQFFLVWLRVRIGLLEKER